MKTKKENSKSAYPIPNVDIPLSNEVIEALVRPFRREISNSLPNPLKSIIIACFSEEQSTDILHVIPSGIFVANVNLMFEGANRVRVDLHINPPEGRSQPAGGEGREISLLPRQE